MAFINQLNRTIYLDEIQQPAKKVSNKPRTSKPPQVWKPFKKKKNNLQTIKWWCDGLGLFCCFVAMTICHDGWNNEMLSLAEDHEKECLTISLQLAT